MKLSKNQLRDLVNESYFEVMLEDAIIQEEKNLAHIGCYVVGMGMLMNERMTSTDGVLQESVLLNEKKAKWVKNVLGQILKRPNILKYPTMGGVAYGLGTQALKGIGTGIEKLGGAAKDFIKDAGENLLPVAGVAVAGTLGLQALKNKGDTKKAYAQVKKAGKKNIKRSGKKGIENIKKGGKWVVVKTADGTKAAVKMTKAEYAKYKKRQKEKNKPKAGTYEHISLPLEAIQRVNQMSLQELAPMMAIGAKALDIINETNDYNLPPVQENEQMSNEEFVINMIIKEMDITHKTLTENFGNEELAEHAKVIRTFVEGNENVPVTITNIIENRQKLQELGPILTLIKPQQLMTAFNKAKDFATGKINIMGKPTEKAKKEAETSEPYTEENLGMKKRGLKYTPLTPSQKSGEAIRKRAKERSAKWYQDRVGTNPKPLGEIESIDEIEETLKQLRNEKIAESIPRKVKFQEVQRWMGNLEENKFKKTYINDAKRVAWLVNNKLSEDYSKMPASYRRKTEGVSYARERYLAKEFIKQINSKQLHEEDKESEGGTGDTGGTGDNDSGTNTGKNIGKAVGLAGGAALGVAAKYGIPYLLAKRLLKKHREAQKKDRKED